MAACLASPAHAAHWAVTYQCSGTETYIGFYDHQLESDPISYSSASAEQYYSELSFLQMDETITPVLTWTKDAETVLPPAPTQIIAQIASDASADISLPVTATMPVAMASDSLDTTSPPVITQNPTYASYQISGTHYLLVPNPTAQTTVTMAGIAVSLLASNTGPFIGWADGYVNITVTPFYPTLNLPGTTKDSNGNYNILVGQGCTASLSGLPPFATAAGNKTTYAWGISGTTFQTWSPTTPATGNAPPNPNASYYVGGPGILYNPTAHWYWNDAMKPNKTMQAETVFYRATLRPITGQGNPFTLTQTQPVSVYAPVVTQNTNTTGMGYVGPYGSTTNVAVFAGPSPLMKNYGQTDGSTWQTNIALPSSPPPLSAPIFSGTGKFGYAQIVNPGEYVTPDGSTPVGATDNGAAALDNSFPYATTRLSDGTLYNDGDSPALDNLSDLFASVTLTDSFQTYLMFQPPGSDIQWVPLSESDWDTNFKNVPRPSSGHWSDFPPTQSVGPVEFGTSGFQFKPQNKFPSWTKILLKGTPFLHN